MSTKHPLTGELRALRDQQLPSIFSGLDEAAEYLLCGYALAQEQWQEFGAFMVSPIEKVSQRAFVSLLVIEKKIQDVLSKDEFQMVVEQFILPMIQTALAEDCYQRLVVVDELRWGRDFYGGAYTPSWMQENALYCFL